MPYKEIKKSKFYEITKRIMDIISSIILMIIFSPIVAFVVLAIKINSKGPILADTPERVGRNGNLFKMYKFRSMIQNAHELLRENPKYAKFYEEYKKGSYKLKDDPRITIVGHVIRKFSLDEVPQLMNVLKGDMSLIGPRPLRTFYLPLYNDLQKCRHDVRPGITGWAQVNGRNAISWTNKFEYDISYVHNISFALDLKIFFFTIKKVFKREGISQEGQATIERFNGFN